MIKKNINLICMFLLIYVTSSFISRIVSGYLLLLVQTILSLILIVNNSKTFSVRKNTFAVLVFLVITSFITMIVNQENGFDYIQYWIALVIGFIVFSSIKFVDFASMLIKIMYITSIISLIVFVISLTFPSIILFFPVITNEIGTSVNFLGVSVVNFNSITLRNYSYFREPGAFQIFLNLALLFELFFTNESKRSLKKAIIFIITIATTLSTAGIIISLLIIIGFVIFEKEINKTILVISLVGLVVIGFYIYQKLPYYAQFTSFGKLEILFNSDITNLNIYGSTIARVSSIKSAISGFLENPVFGVGFEKLKEYGSELSLGFLTFTPLNWFGHFGLLIGVFYLIPFYNLTVKKEKQIFKKLFFLLIYLFLFSSQNFNRDAFYQSLVFYGFYNSIFYLNNIQYDTIDLNVNKLEVN